MPNFLGCAAVQRIVYPLILTACVLFRPVALSLPYLLLLLYLPFVPIASAKTIRRHTGCYFYIAVATCTIIVLLHIAFQVVLATMGQEFLVHCQFLEILLRHIGLIKLNQMHYSLILLWFLPDVVMFLSTIVVFVLLRKMSIVPTPEAGVEAPAAEPAKQKPSGTNFDEVSPETLLIMKQIGTFFAMVTLLLAATLRPSVPGSVYFIVFLGAATWWSCYRELSKAFAIICRIVLVFLAVHIASFLSYQTPWPQEQFPANNTVIRFLGFSPLAISPPCGNTTDNREIVYNRDVNWDSYLNPLAILLCYYTLVITSRLILNNQSDIEKREGAFSNLENGAQHLSRQVSIRLKRKTIVRKKVAAKDTWHGAADKVRRRLLDEVSEPTERTPLMRRSMRKLKTLNLKKRDGSQDDTILDDMEGEEVNPTEEELPPTIWEQMWYGLGQVGDFLFKNSYILNNIIMMSWSIVYHSWITFIFLLWANLLWIIPNQRKNMLRCAPFVVFYAEFLLLAQYVYGMDLTEQELPSKIEVNGVNLEQIGFVRYATPCLPLLLKTLFTLGFWVTLRQRAYEAKVQRQSSTLAHLAAPFQLTVSAATTNLTDKKDDKKSKFILKAGQILKTLLLQLWIWVVVLALFLCAIYGKEMTAFRITYMTLFLAFLITFQLSWRLWKKLMYSFWVVVIGFAMLTLIMIYTYQFTDFDKYWTKYVGIPESLQRDIGLVKYEVKELFLSLVYPTLVVIITVVQLQIFHDKYMEMLSFPLISRRENSESGIHPPSSVNYGSCLEQDTEKTEEPPLSRHFELADLKKITFKQVTEWLSKVYDHIKILLEFVFIFLEMHLTKFILILGFTIGIHNVSVIHILIIVLTAVATTSKSQLQSIMTRVISLVIGVLLISKMIYQIEYIDHSENNVYCDNDNTSLVSNATVHDPNKNNADWFGFSKIKENQTLAEMLRGYIGYIMITTVYTMILLWQKRSRHMSGKPMTRAKVIFPRVTRNDADKDLTHMLKYLMNYLFYKFGIELTLIMLIVLIGTRMDFVALIYSVWLCVLFSSTREKQAHIWPFFKMFIFVLIVVQYVIVVGTPPFLCINYRPFDSDYWRHFQDWAWLPDQTLRQQAAKLRFDFLLLIFVCRQMHVFRIEKQYDGDGSAFPGGSNKSVVDEIHNMGQVPITHSHDYVTFTRNWLDIVKCGVFLGFFWITLAIVFLAGTNRVNIFSIGYLVGSFIFLWQGAEYYLRPIHTILKWWKYLIGYNVVVIVTKTFLQIPGCIFIQDLKSACWVVQLFGMSCIRKFNQMDTDDYANTYNVGSCKVSDGDIGLVWDGICFVVLIIQLRIFQSYYFCHIINESKASTILASRGAELIEALRRKQVKLQATLETEILQKIKQKMDRIKANQQKLQPAVLQPKTHFQDGENAPLARTTSMSSCAGYHTPIEDEVAGEGVSDLPSDLGRGQSFLSTQAPSPMSAVMTVSLEGYLDPQRLSFGSPPGSDIVLPPRPCSEESFPVFSPVPPVDAADQIQARAPIPAPPASVVQLDTLKPGVHLRQHRRQSSINTVSWTDQGDTSSGRARPLSNLDPSDEIDETSVKLRRRPSHRRQSSVAISWSRFEDQSDRRRDSNASWARDEDIYDEVSTRTGRSRPNSWGPVGDFYYRESLCLSETDRSLFSHQESVRSGDYYLFEDIGEKIELDLMNTKPPASCDDNILRKSISNKQTIEMVLASKLKQRRQPVSDGSSLARHPSLPEEHVSGVDPRSTSSDPILGTKSGAGFGSKKRVDEFSQPDGQQPSTSSGPPKKTQDPAELASSSDEVAGLAFITAFISGTMVSITLRLYRLSRNYRYVMRVLSKEKKDLKAEKDFGQGHRIGTGNVWAPMPAILRTRGETHSVTASVESLTLPIDEREARSVNNETPSNVPANGTTIAHLLRPTMFSTSKEPPALPEEERRTSIVPAIRIMAPSLERGLDESSRNYESDVSSISSHNDISEIEEDFYSQEHSLITELFSSLWFALISNTDLVCYMFVFINMVASASILSLPMPFMVFLWGTLTVPRPSKTFWVTLIAYTQVVVLIKCVCQLQIVWWNQSPITTNPMAPARIIGIEQKPNYASYDLALLLVIFFHRFVQKQMGIWRSSDDDESDGGFKTRIKPPGTDVGVKSIVVKHGEFSLKLANTNRDSVDDNDDDKVLNVTSTPQESTKYFPAIAALSTKKYCSSCTAFFKKLLKQVNRVTADVYAYIFLCDFLNFFVLLFGFTSFGSTQGDGGVTSYLEENKIPGTFLIMLLLQFVSIIVDRALYLRKNLAGKIIFQFITVIGMHMWLFFLVPVFSEKSFNEKLPPVLFYIIKCFYFLLSAYQIRCGYPRRILGNCLTKGFSMINLGAFKVYMLTPFLFELRALMDWMWTDSSMPLFEWLKMEDIFAKIFELKCSRQIEDEFPAQRGMAKGISVKYIMGGSFLFAIISLVWGPLALFALGNTVGAPNIPLEVSMELRIGPYEPIYRMSAQSSHIHPFKEENWASLQKLYGEHRSSLTLMSNYESEDVAAVVLGANSTSLWIISPPDFTRLTLDLKNNVVLKIRFKYSVTRATSDKDQNTAAVSAESTYNLDKDSPARAGLIAMLEGNSTKRVELPFLFPKFLKIRKTEVQLAHELCNKSAAWHCYRNLALNVFRSMNGTYGMVTELCESTDDGFTFPLGPCTAYEGQNSVMYTFSERELSKSLGVFSTIGIIGIYSTLVVMGARIFRKILVVDSSQIIYSEMPCVDRLLQLCFNIYLVKNLGDLKPIKQMMPNIVDEDDAKYHRNVTLLMHSSEGQNKAMFWELLENCTDSFYKNILSKIEYANCTHNLILYTFSDKLFPPTINWLTGGGVIGIYTTFVFLASRFFRGLFAGGSTNIMWDELPYVDRILQLCLDIYLVRESMEFALEEDLFAKLIFLYRSPETMIKWTRPLEEQSDEDATEADGSDNDGNGDGGADDDDDNNDNDDDVAMRKPIKN